MKNVILTKSRFLGLDFVRIPSTVCIKDFVGYPTLGNQWWAEMDSNHRPLGYQPSALTSRAISPNGGDKGIRTLDPLLAKQVLSQLSYTPARLRFGFRCPLCI